MRDGTWDNRRFLWAVSHQAEPHSPTKGLIFIIDIVCTAAALSGNWACKMFTHIQLINYNIIKANLHQEGLSCLGSLRVMDGCKISNRRSLPQYLSVLKVEGAYYYRLVNKYTSPTPDVGMRNT